MVGVDGSDGSKEALRWALAQARLTGTPVLAVITWGYPAGFGWAPPYPDGFDPEGEARSELYRVIGEVAGSDAGVEVERLVVEGHPAPALVAASEGEAMLVVGSRGHGGFTGKLLGSVSDYCATHAHGPVVVVRPR